MSAERLEDRNSPAVASFSTGVLAIDFTAAGATAEAVTINDSGGNITLTGSVSGTVSTPAANVTQIVLSASGNSTNQSAVFGGAAFTLSGGLSSTGVDAVTINQAILATGTSGIAINASGLQSLTGSGVVIAAPITTAGGDISITGTGSASGSNGVLVNSGGKIQAGGSGKVTIVGSAGATGTSGSGVVVSGTGIITSSGGTVSITGNGGANSVSQDGILVTGGGTITAGGTGAVVLTGSSGSSLTNVVLSGSTSTISAPGGPVTANGVLVSAAPSFTSAATATFQANVANSFSLAAIGSPAPTIVSTGTLPANLTFSANGTSGTLSGSPGLSSVGSFSLPIFAYDGISFQQNLALKINASLPIAVSGITDIVYDGSRQLLYILTNSSTVQRYDLVNNVFLSSFSVPSGKLFKADITPDGAFLYATVTGFPGTIWKLDLNSGAVKELGIPSENNSTYDIAIADNGFAIFDTTGSTIGSAYKLRKINLATDVITDTTKTVNQTTPISRAGDGSDLFIGVPNDTGGSLVAYYASTDSFSPPASSGTTITAPTAVSRDGTLFAAQINGFVTICDSSFKAVANLPAQLGGYAFSPTQDLLYVVGGSTITAYDTNTWQVKYQFSADLSLPNATISSDSGQIAFNSDGSQLYLVTSTGIREYQLPANTGLAASLNVNVSKYVAQNTSTSVTVTVRDAAGNVATGYRGTLTISVASDPGAALPAPYAFAAADAGTHTFQISLAAVQSAQLSFTDAANGLSLTVNGIVVHATNGAGGAASLPISGVRDVIVDPTRNLVYATAINGTVERYDPATDSLLTPWTLSYAPLGGGDITPDGKYLYVAENRPNAVQDIVHKIDLATGAVSTITFNNNSNGGAWDLKIANNGQAFVTLDNATYLEVINISSDTASAETSPFSQAANIERTPDASRLAFVDFDGEFTFTSSTGKFFSTSSYFPAGNGGSVPLAISPDGNLIASQVDGDIAISDASYHAVANLPALLGGGAFSPTQDLYFAADAASDVIDAYDTNTWQRMYQFPIGVGIGAADASPTTTGNGTMKFSADGTRLYLVVAGAVRQYLLPQSTGVAASLSVDAPTFVPANAPESVTVTVKDATGNVAVGYRGTVTISVATDPAAVLPVPYTFTAADNGVHTFQIALSAVRSDSLSVSAPGLSTFTVPVIQVHAPGATPSLISMSNTKDLIVDSLRNRLYVTTTTGLIERYDVAAETLLPPWTVSNAALSGGDITPDGKYLYVTESQPNVVQNIIRKVDLDTGASTVVDYAPAGADAGGFDLKIAGNGLALLEDKIDGTGVVRMSAINIATGAVVSTGQNHEPSSAIVRSADRSRLYVLTSFSSNVLSYSSTSGTFATSTLLDNQVTAANRNGSLLAYASSGSTVVLNGANLNTVVTTISGESGGVAFDPNRDVLYIADVATNKIYAYDSNTWALEFSTPIGATLASATPLGAGQMAVAADSSRLFVETNNGVMSIALPSAAPVIVSAASATFTVGQAGSFRMTAYGPPTPTIAVAGGLPSGVTFAPSTGLLAGTPAPGSGGVYPLVVTANNGVGTAAQQNFSLTVDEAPSIVSTTAEFVAGQLGTFAIRTTGFPAPTISFTGSLPTGLSLNGGVLSGTPTSRGIYDVTLIAGNGTAPSAQQTLEIRVEDVTPPVVTITAAPPALSDNPTARFAFYAIDPLADGFASGVARIEVSLDGSPFTTATSPAVFGGLTSGNHTFSARAFDNAGNVSTVVSDTWNVNLAATTETIDVASVALQPSANPALDNDFTRFVDAFANLQPGDVVRIHGTLDWSEPNALASWKATGEAYALPHVDNLTVDAASPGDGIHGPGDDPSLSGEGPFYFDGLGADQSWNITGLTISNFDTALFYSPETDVTDYAGTHITNNTITVPSANPGAQNGGILLGPSPNQTIQGNTINLAGDGDVTSASFGISSFSYDGAGAWNNLLLDNNTINVTTVGASGKVIGIAENSGSVGSNIAVTNNTFHGDSGSFAGNQQVAFGITSQNSATGTVIYAGNTVNGAKDGFAWGDPEASPPYDFTGAQYLPIAFSNTSLTSVGVGFVDRDGGKATIAGATITNSGLFDFGTAFSADGNGTVITVTDPVANFTGVASLASQTNSGLVVFLNSTATVQNVSKPEGNTGFTLFSFPVMLAVAPGANQIFTVDYSTSNGTADGNDYNTASGTLTFAPGQSSATIAVKVLGDFNVEPDETFLVNLSKPLLYTNGSPAPGHLSSTQAIGTIQNDDSTTIAASISGSAATKSATMGATTLMTFAATLNSAPPAGEYFTVNYHASNGTARGGIDYSAPDGTLTFLPGSTTPLSPLTVTVIGSPAINPPENFTITLDTPLLHFNGFTQSIPGNIATGTATGTLGSPPPSGAVVSINNVSRLEGTPIPGNSASDFTTFTFTISCTGTLTTSIKVNWATANGSALGGQDYQQNSGQVTLTPTVASQTISVTVFADKTVEPDETFLVNLTNPGLNGFSNYTLGAATGIGTIVNDD